MSCVDLLGRTWAPPAVTSPAPPAPPPSKAAPDLPDPPPLIDDPLTVDDAWALFGITQKRAPKNIVKSRYRAFAAKWHPDYHPEDQVTATAQLTRANAAWTLLEKHCKW